MNVFRIKFLIVSIFLSFSLFSQVVTTTVEINEKEGIGQDVMVGNSGLLDKNFGEFPYLNVYHSKESVPVVFRSFLQFDLSKIPSNAIIVDAELILFPKSVGNDQYFDCKFSRVDGSWNKDGITGENQNEEFLSDAISFSPPSQTSLDKYLIDVKGHVQNMVNYPYNNHGWKITLKDEKLEGNYGVSFYSSNYTDVNKRPRLNISYVLPIEINVSVSHCTPSNTDGSVDFTLTSGSGVYSSYWIYKIFENPSRVNTQLTSVVSSGIISGNSIHAENLEPGLYVIRVTNPDYSGYEKLHFMVGREGEITEAIIASYGFIDQTKIGINLGSSASTKDYANTAFGLSATSIGAATSGTASYGSSNAYHISSLIDFNLNVDAGLDIVSANLHMGKWQYYQDRTSSNEAIYRPVTSDWDVNKVTWNSRPSISLEPDVILPKSSNPHGYSHEGDIVNVKSLMEYWQTNPNYGLKIDLTNYEYQRPALRRQRKIGGGSYFRFSYTVKSELTATFNETTNKGTIVVDAPDGELPYTYLISYDPISDLQTIWNGIKDSIQIDSTFFFRGKDNTKQFVFDGLESDRYYVAVFDNKGEEIYQSSAIVTMDTKIKDNIDLVQDGNKFRLSNDGTNNGSMSFNHVMVDGSSMEVKVDALGSFMSGFSEHNDPSLVKDAKDYYLGYSVDENGRLILYREGVEIVRTTVLVNDIIVLDRNTSDIALFINNERIHTEGILNISKVLKPELGIYRAGVHARLDVIFFAIERPRYFDHSPYGEIVCNGRDKASFWWCMNQNSLNIIESSIVTTIVAIGASNSPFSHQITGSACQSVLLDEGVYKVTITWMTTTGSFGSEIFNYTVGKPINWNIVNDLYALNGTVNSITNSNWQGSVIGNAISSNVLDEAENGWVSTNVEVYRRRERDDFYRISGYGEVGFVDFNNQEKISVRLHSLGSSILNKYVTIEEFGSLWSSNSFMTNAEGIVKIDREVLGSDEVFRVYDRYGALKHTYTTAVTTDLKIFGQARASMIYETTSSFCDGITDDSQCGHLDYELNGNYYYTNNGKFCFVYNEEYNDPNIEFNIYNINNNVIANEGDFYTDPLTLGENRIVLDFSAISCFAKGMYMLEVINDKKEKFFLRIYNDSPMTIIEYDIHHPNFHPDPCFQFIDNNNNN